MNYKELEQEVKRLEQQIKDLKVKLEEKAEKKAYEVKVPEDIEDYYVLDGCGKVYSLKGFSMNYIRCQYERGLAFKTREQAEQFKKEQILLLKLHKWAEEQNGGWTPNWNEMSKVKYCVEYNNYTGNFFTDYYSGIFTFSKLPLFKTEEIAQQFIKEFGDEIKEVLC